MRTSVVNHPPDEPLIIIRQWQLIFCDGNEVAAALLSFFEYWHNIKLDISHQNKKMNEVAKNHGDAAHHDTSLYQWHTEKELIDGIQRIAKSGKTLTRAIDTLVSKSIITIHKNPNPKYKFDKKRYFLFYPNIVNEWLGLEYRPSKNTLSKSKNTSRSSKIPSASSKIPSAITETTPEITKPESLKASSANADSFSLPISLLSEKQVRALELSIKDWKQYLEDEQAEKGRKGVVSFVESKILYWNLLPHTDAEKTLFEILKVEYGDDGGKTPPAKFPGTETKRLFNEAAEFHNGTLEAVIKKAIHKRGKSIQKIVDYISSPEWKKRKRNGQGPARNSQQKIDGKTPRRSGESPAPGSGQTPEMAKRLREAFAPK